MGQMTYGVLFGAQMNAPKEFGDDGWYELVERYPHGKLDRPHGDTDFEGIGFWCAVGASGEDGVPDLTGFPLDDFGSASKAHTKALEKARAAWTKFAAWCAVPQSGTIGTGKWKRKWSQAAIVFPEPRLYLVQTEVA